MSVLSLSPGAVNVMLTFFRSFVAFGILLSVVACQVQSRADLLRVIDETPAKNLRSYQFDPTSPLIARVKPAPDFVVRFWGQTDKALDYASYTPTPAELGMIDEYLSKLPRHIKEVLRDRLIAIYFINNLQGSGVTDYVLNNRRDIYTVMLFNPATLKTDLSALLTFRANSCFIGNASGVKLEINSGTRYTGFMYALVHESAHAVDYVESYTPYLEKQIQLIKHVQITQTPFTKDVWLDPDMPRPPYDFPDRRSLLFYGTGGGPKISISESPRIYRQLAATPFASLYGSVNWADDFADTVMFYHLTQVLGQPYEIRLLQKSGPAWVYRPMDSFRVRERFSVIKSLY
jgi:hypothetical protein